MSLPLVLRRSALVALLALALPLAVAAQAQPARPAAPSSTPYPGEITLQVDVTDLDRKILRVQQPLPVEPYENNRVGGALIVVDPASNRTSGALLVRSVR